MSSLEDLVTSNLAPESKDSASEEFEPLPPLEVIAGQERASLEEIGTLCKELPAKIKENPHDAPYLVAQLLAYLPVGVLSAGQKNRTLWPLALAATYSYSPDSDLYEDICDWVNGIEKNIEERKYRSMEKIVLTNTTSRLDFLAEFFEEEFVEELVFITGVQPATAKRWIGGAGISWTNSQQIHLLARIFYALQHKQKLQKDEALLFYKSPWQDSSKSPREMMQGYTYITGSELRDMLRSIGIQD